MITIVLIGLIAGIISMSIVNTNMNAMARSGDHHDHRDNKSNDRHGCVYQKHVKVDQKHVCIDRDNNRSSDYPPEEIILSSPGSAQQQLYLNRIPATGNP